MKYVYTESGCHKCEELKTQLRKEGIMFVERHASRIKALGDAADREALIVASMQNMELPVAFDFETTDD